MNRAAIPLVLSTISFLLLPLCLVILGCSVSVPLPTAPDVDLKRFAGTWFEIASRPNSFQEGCFGTKAEYSLQEDGTIAITNSCRYEDLKGPVRVAQGRGWIGKDGDPAKLRVRFFWPFVGDYWILALDNEYQYALVGTPSRRYFWILARQPFLAEEIFSDLVLRAKELGFPVEEMLQTPQEPERPHRSLRLIEILGQ